MTVEDEDGVVEAAPVSDVELHAATIRKAAATAANRRPAYGDFIRVLSF
jgi:hypothetical protein